MRVVIPQITWHSRDPVLSIDFDPRTKEGGFYRVATGGGDCQLLVWHLKAVDTFKPELTCVAELKRHEKPVNVVRFSPDGNYIATGGDDAYIILWKEGEKTDGEGDNVENWQFDRTFRKHIEDVTDLSWSPDGAFLLSGSIDNSAVLWDVKKGVALHIWNEKEHTGFVHGVAYDPLNEFAATMCIDRNLRLFDLKSKKTVSKALKYPEEWLPPELLQELNDEKENLPATRPADVPAETEVQTNVASTPKRKPGVFNRLFYDEVLPTFCRRLGFSPKGELLLVPGGMLPPRKCPAESKMDSATDDASKPNHADSSQDQDKKLKEKKAKKKDSMSNAVIVFCRHSWTNPCAVIPTLDSYSIACKFNPIYFHKSRKQHEYGESFVPPKKGERYFASVGKLSCGKANKYLMMNMPYRLVYAVATNDAVLIGDTASSEPLALVRSIHPARISDLAWASNGRILMVSSTDGYCSIISFEQGELGDEFVVEPENFPATTRDCFPILPPEPKPEKMPKKKKPSKAKVETECSPNKDKVPVAVVKTPNSDKKPAIKSRNLEAMFAAAAVSKEKKPPASETPAKPHSESPYLPISAEVEKDSPPEDNSGTDPAAETGGETPVKFKPQKTTLDRWFKATPKGSSDNSVKDKELQSKNASPASAVSSVPLLDKRASNSVEHKSKDEEVEVITVDDDEPGPSAPKIYPMTPPVAKPIAARRLPTSTGVSPLVSTPSSNSQKRKQGDITPEDIHNLITSPIKCRRIMEDRQPIMESSKGDPDPEQTQTRKNETITNPSDATSSSNDNKNDLDPSNPADSTCPSSPVSSTPNLGYRPPRRITLTTLSTKPTIGKLD